MSESLNPIMTLEQAKQVRWLRNNPKPLGELLNSGYLNKQRLQWAAANAYNPALRQAAQVILQVQVEQSTMPAHSMLRQESPLTANPLKLRMSLETARAVPWPFRPFAGQTMGELLDTQQITTKDLGYAIDRARNAQVREAAITLMTTRLEEVISEPSPLTEEVKVVSSGKSYAIRRTYFYTMLQGILFGILLATLFAVLYWSFTAVRPERAQEEIEQVTSNPILIVGIVIVVALLLAVIKFVDFLFDRSLKWTEKKIAENERGAEGEARTLEIIERTLDGQWVVFRNVMIPGQRGDIDMVLLGPTGLWALEVKNWNGKYRYHGDDWQHFTNKHWKPLRQKPSQQARKHAGRLGEFLKADGIQKWVSPVVVWANTESSLDIDNPATAIWRLERLQDELANLWQGKPLDETVRVRVVEKLTQLCETERKRQAEPL
jgi:hypothetical protein